MALDCLCTLHCGLGRERSIPVAFGAPTHPLSFLPCSHSRWLEHTCRLLRRLLVWRTSQPSPSSFLAELSFCPPLFRKPLLYTTCPQVLFPLPQDPRPVYFPAPSTLMSTAFQQPVREMGTRKQRRKMWTLKEFCKIGNRTSMDQGTVQYRMTEPWAGAR